MSQKDVPAHSRQKSCQPGVMPAHMPTRMVAMLMGTTRLSPGVLLTACLGSARSAVLLALKKPRIMHMLSMLSGAL